MINEFISEYNFRYLDVRCDKILAYSEKFERYSEELIDKIDDETFSEWKYRYYVAGKYILATTVLVNSYQYAGYKPVKPIEARKDLKFEIDFPKDFFKDIDSDKLKYEIIDNQYCNPPEKSDCLKRENS